MFNFNRKNYVTATFNADGIRLWSWQRNKHQWQLQSTFSLKGDKKNPCLLNKKYNRFIIGIDDSLLINKECIFSRPLKNYELLKHFHYFAKDYFGHPLQDLLFDFYIRTIKPGEFSHCLFAAKKQVIQPLITQINIPLANIMAIKLSTFATLSAWWQQNLLPFKSFILCQIDDQYLHYQVVNNKNLIFHRSERFTLSTLSIANSLVVTFSRLLKLFQIYHPGTQIPHLVLCGLKPNTTEFKTLLTEQFSNIHCFEFSDRWLTGFGLLL